MKRSELNLKVGDKVLVDFLDGRAPEATSVQAMGRPGYVHLHNPAGFVPFYPTTQQGIDTLGGRAYRVIEVNGTKP
jgi:hypothetical protein